MECPSNKNIIYFTVCYIEQVAHLAVEFSFFFENIFRVYVQFRKNIEHLWSFRAFKTRKSVADDGNSEERQGGERGG